MPINLPNGGNVDEIILPNGASASEVYGPNGNLVWQDVVIPDSAIHQWRFDEGSGSTVADDISTNDGSVVGPTWFSDANLEGGHGLSFDEIDDYVSFDLVGQMGQGEQFSIAITVKADDLTTDEQVIWQHNHTSDDRVVACIHNGEFTFNTWDGSNRRCETSMSAGATTDRFRLGIAVDEPNNQAWIYKNGTQSNDGTTSAPSDDQSGHRLGYGVADSGRAFGGDLDNPVVYSSILSDEEFSNDYHAQPWS